MRKVTTESKRLHYLSNVNVTVTLNKYGAFGVGYISYVKFYVLEILHNNTIYTIYNNNIIYFNILM